jgi:hypothetical protein
MRDSRPVDVRPVIAGASPVAHPAMTALARGIPLTLLMDLLDAAGPDSRTVLATETADLGWLRDLAYPGAARQDREDRDGSPEVSGRAAG